MRLLNHCLICMNHLRFGRVGCVTYLYRTDRRHWFAPLIKVALIVCACSWRAGPTLVPKTRCVFCDMVFSFGFGFGFGAVFSIELEAVVSFSFHAFTHPDWVRSAAFGRSRRSFWLRARARWKWSRHRYRVTSCTLLIVSLFLRFISIDEFYFTLKAPANVIFVTGRLYLWNFSRCCVFVESFVALFSALPQGVTPLMYASLSRKIHTMRLLIELGANKEASSKVRSMRRLGSERLSIFVYIFSRLIEPVDIGCLLIFCTWFTFSFISCIRCCTGFTWCACT